MGKKKENQSNGEKSSRRGGGESKGAAIEDMRQIEEIANQMSKKNADYEKQLTKLRSQHDDLVRKNLELNQKLNDVETRNSANSARLLDLNNRKETLDKKKKQLEDENSALKQERSKLEDREAQVNKDLKQTTKEFKDEQAEGQRLKDEVNLASGKDAQGKPKQYKRSEEDEKLMRDKDDQIAALKRELAEVQKASGQVRQEMQHRR